MPEVSPLSELREMVAEAWRRRGAMCLWNSAPSPAPDGSAGDWVRHARAVARRLERDGDREAFFLGRRLRDAADALGAGEGGGDAGRISDQGRADALGEPVPG